MKKLVLIIFISVFVKVKAQDIHQADSLLSIGRYKKALTILENSKPSFLSNIKIAQIYDVLDNSKKAVFYYKKALDFKDDYLTNLKLGKALKKAGNKKEAIILFEKIAKKDIANLLVKYELGKLYLQTNKLDKAKQTFNELITKDKENANYSYQLATVYQLLKKRNLKINALLDTYQKDSMHLMATVKLAKAYLKLRDKDSANLFIAKGLQINPERLDLNRMKINNFYTNKEYKKAIGLLYYIDSLAPNEHYTHKMLGRSYYKLKDLKNAEKHLKTATTINGEDFKAYKSLGDIHFEQKQIKNAMFCYATASYIAKTPRDEAYLGLAKVYSEMKLPKQVLENYKEAVHENSKNFQALFLLAKFSEDYYKDKKIAYNLYKKYLNYFEGKFKEHDKFVNFRIKKIKKDYFLKGETLE